MKHKRSITKSVSYKISVYMYIIINDYMKNAAGIDILFFFLLFLTGT